VKIIYLHQYFATPNMVGGTRSYEMARRLVRYGHEVHMITSCGDRRGSGWTTTEEAGIHVHWCAVPYSNHMSYGQRLRAFMRFAWLSARKAASLPGDVVFATSTPLTIALPAVWAARKRSIPMVFEVRDLWPEMPIAVGALRSRPTIAAACWLERFAYRHAAHVVALSPGMKAGVVATGYPAEQVTVIPNSCDLGLFRGKEEQGREFRRRHEWLQDRPLVVYAGALGFINGVDYLARLAAVVQSRNPEIRFLVVGQGREELRVRKVAEGLGVLDKNFFMLPAVPKAEMPALLSAADLATSLFLDVKQMWANSANKVFDALAAGRPIAINHEGWLADMIRETGCGLVLDPHDLVTAADRLLDVLGDRRWQACARRAALAVGRERFDREKLAAQLEMVLRNVLTPVRQRMAA
jgi:glycosyltransferase involved in cell wall biosynthesis